MSNTWCACLKRKFPNSRSQKCPPSISFHPTVAFSAHPVNIRVTIFQKLRHWSYGEQQRGKNGRWDWMAIWTLKTDEKRIIRYLTVEDVLSSTAKTTDTLWWLISDICKDNSRIIIIFPVLVIPRQFLWILVFIFSCLSLFCRKDRATIDVLSRACFA